MQFSVDAININPQAEVEHLVAKLKQDVVHTLKKRGAVIGVSGGVDSSVVLALCVRAFGPGKVLAVMMPEKESSPQSLTMAKKVIKKFNVQCVIEDMTSALAGFGCYQRRDQAIKRVFPEYDESFKAKIVLNQDILKRDSLNLFHLKIVSPTGEEKTARLPLKEYLEIVAASNFKQRSRMSMLYYHAESRNYAVIGTSNKNEHKLGFFVKYGDGGADVQPIVHLFKTQIYQLAGYLDIPSKIRKRKPTSDTYSAEQTQEEFFFRAPFDVLDRTWHGWEQKTPVEVIAHSLGLSIQEVQNVINDIARKTKTTEYLRAKPL